MFHNFLKITWRSLLKDKTTALINIGGLALGMTAFLLIINYVRFELSFDKFHANAERIYRVESMFFKDDLKTDHWGSSSNGYVPAMKAVFPEIEAYSRYNWHNSDRTVRYGDIKFREQNVCFADSNFFEFFNFPLLQGNPATVLREANTVALSETAARKYFGEADPIGKIITIGTIANSFNCMVTGVFADIPANSHLQFDFLMSWQTSAPWMRDFWYLHESYSYVRLRPDANTGAIEKGFSNLAEQYKTEDSLKDLIWGIDLVPLNDIHLNPPRPYEHETKGNLRAVQFLLAIAWVILAISWINYTNLSAAKMLERAREVGLRKLNGSSKRQLVIQFLFESVLINFFSVLLMFFLLVLATMYLPAIFGSRFDIPFWNKGINYFLMIVIGLTGAVLAGIYPALLMTRIPPITMLRGKFTGSGKGAPWLKGLIVIQFAASILLITGTLIAYMQLRYMQSRDLGVNISQTLIMEAPIQTDDYDQKVESFKEEIKKLSGVGSVTGSGAIPGKEVAKFLANRRQYDPPENDRLYETMMCDYDFIDSYGLKLLAGRNFDRNRPSDKRALVINESAVRQFGFASNEEAIDNRVLLEVTRDRPHEIIGVVKDYHQQSLQKKFTPIIFCMDPDYSWIPISFYSVKAENSSMSSTVASIEKLWYNYFPESSFDFFFLDDFFNRQYKDEQIFGRVFTAFSLTAVAIAIMGLLGILIFSAQQKLREIGIRKVHGASSLQVYRMLNRNIVVLILIAAILAVPASWWIMNHWLDDYAFRISPGWWVYAIPVMLLTLCAVAAAAYITIRTSTLNPVDILRYE